MTKTEEDGPTYTAEQVSQGQVVLRTPLRKAIFIGGLVLFVLFAAFFGLHGRGH